MELLCFGEPMVELAERPGGLWQQAIGGDCSNVAIAAARQGAAVGMLTALGEDQFGDAIRAGWQEEGVDAQLVTRDPTAATGLYFIHYDGASHQFSYRRQGSAASRVDGPWLGQQLARLQGQLPRVLHLSAISQAISASACVATIQAMDWAAHHGIKISYDPNLRLKLWPIEAARPVIEAAAARSDFFMPSIDDARQLTGLSDPATICAHYHGLGAKAILLTLGAEGSLLSVVGQQQYFAAPSVPLVDAAGAGDCFDGAFLAEWLRAADLALACRYATVAAALSVGAKGAIAGIPHRPMVEEMLAHEA